MLNLRKYITLFCLLGLTAWIGAIDCPNGFMAYNNVCVQPVKECPPNFVWQGGICIAAVTAPTTALQTVPCQGQTNCLCPCPCPAVQTCQQTQTVTPCQSNQPCASAIPTQSTPCTTNQPCSNNQVVTPCAVQPCSNNLPCAGNQPCPAAPCASNQPCGTNQPCANNVPCTQSTPCTTNQPCSNNQVVTPCAGQPCSNNQPCTANQPCPAAPCASNQPCGTNQPCANNVPCTQSTPCVTNPQITPCPNNPPSPQPNQPPPPQPESPSTKAPPTPQTQSPPTKAPPPLPTEPPIPLPITKCPPGTVLIDGVCRLIGCGKWFVYVDGNCVRVQCPEGTYWTGEECVEPEPHKFNVSFKNTITTQINRTEPAIVIDNVNNLNVTVVNTVPSSNDCNDDYCDYDAEVPEKDYEDEPKKENCCTVITPRTCKPKVVGDQKSWSCYSRRYKRCGSFCIAPTIYLKAPEPIETPNEIVLPPMDATHVPQPPSIEYPALPPTIGSYDCSGCVSGQPQYCAPYCHRSICPPHSCSYYDQRQYCLDYPGQNGCNARDGCHSNWCSGGF